MNYTDKETNGIKKAFTGLEKSEHLGTVRLMIQSIIGMNQYQYPSIEWVAFNSMYADCYNNLMNTEIKPDVLIKKFAKVVGKRYMKNLSK